MNKISTKIEKAQIILFGIFFALLSFFYGVYALVNASCILLGRGNIFVTFYGAEARLLSLIYIGAGLWLFQVYSLISVDQE